MSRIPIDFLPPPSEYQKEKLRLGVKSLIRAVQRAAPLTTFALYKSRTMLVACVVGIIWSSCHSPFHSVANQFLQIRGQKISRSRGMRPSKRDGVQASDSRIREIRNGPDGTEGPTALINKRSLQVGRRPYFP